MNKTAIIIPSRLGAQRLPNKPLKMIRNKEMIIHVYEAAVKSKSGEVIVATPDNEIAEVIKRIGGRVEVTDASHQTGTDRIFQVFNNALEQKPEIIINLQGDMPNIDPELISNLVEYMKKNECDIGTYASEFSSEHEKMDKNIVKVLVKNQILNEKFLHAIDFFRDLTQSKNIYHHIGIYGFTKNSLSKFVNFKRSKLEIERKLEQLRALENGMSVHVGLTKSLPLSVDTDKDLEKIKKIMENDKT